TERMLPQQIPVGIEPDNPGISGTVARGLAIPIQRTRVPGGNEPAIGCRDKGPKLLPGCTAVRTVPLRSRRTEVGFSGLTTKPDKPGDSQCQCPRCSHNFSFSKSLSSFLRRRVMR